MDLTDFTFSRGQMNAEISLKKGGRFITHVPSVSILVK